MLHKKSIYTQAVHAGERILRPDFLTVSTPVYNAATYYYPAMDDLDAVFAGTKKGINNNTNDKRNYKEEYPYNALLKVLCYTNSG